MFNENNLHNPFTQLESKNKYFVVRPALVLLDKVLAIKKAKVYAFVFEIEDENKLREQTKVHDFFTRPTKPQYGWN